MLMNCFCGNLMEKKKIQRMDFYFCSVCGYLKKEKILNKEKEKKRYDRHICDENYMRYMKDVKEMIWPYVKGRVLDFGCGKVHALADMIEQDGVECKYYDLYYFPLLDEGMFDTIVLIEVFEHIEDITRLMWDLKEKLNSYGKIIILTQCIPFDVENWWYLRDSTHISFVEEKTMKKLADLVCMKVEYNREGHFFVFYRID